MHIQLEDQKKIDLIFLNLRNKQTNTAKQTFMHF